MANIDVIRKHNLGPAAAKELAEKFAVEMKAKFGILYRWQGDTIKVEIPQGVAKGAKGSISINEKALRVQIELPGMLAFFKSVVEKEVHKHLDTVVGRF